MNNELKTSRREYSILYLSFIGFGLILGLIVFKLLFDWIFEIRFPGGPCSLSSASKEIYDTYYIIARYILLFTLIVKFCLVLSFKDSILSEKKKRIFYIENVFSLLIGLIGGIIVYMGYGCLLI